EKLTAYVQRVDAANAATLMQLYDCYRPYEADFSGYAALPAAAKDACRANVMQLHDAIASRRELYTSRSNAAELERYLRYARTIVQSEQMNSHRTEPDGRDEAMAENVAWFANVEHPGEKVVAWAHNGHVAADADYLMGAQLRRRYFPGRELVIFGFAFDRGQFHAYDTAVRQRQIYSATAPNDGFEAFFRAAGRPLMFVDLREPASSAARDLFERQPKSIWEIGILFDPARPQDYRPSLVLAKNWDVIVWIESVTATKLRP
ncbi:MAG TPA: erythromycin esterase family protein, partial [Thermoanaerobaculia bacterium]